MAVTKVQDWVETEGEPSGSPTIGTGSDRLLVVTVHYEFIGALTTDPPTFTIGGVSYTAVHELFYDTAGDDLYVFVYIWNESAIGSMSGSTISYGDGESSAKVAWSVATFAGVDQTTPCTYDDATAASATLTAPCTADFSAGAANDYSVYAVSSRSNSSFTFDGGGGITQQWQILDTDGGGAGYALASDAWSASSHDFAQGAAARTCCGVGVVIHQVAGASNAAMMNRTMQENMG